MNLTLRRSKKIVGNVIREGFEERLPTGRVSNFEYDHGDPLYKPRKQNGSSPGHMASGCNAVKITVQDLVFFYLGSGLIFPPCSCLFPSYFPLFSL